MKIYDREMSDEEVLKHVRKNLAGVKANKRSRYHTILSMFPDAGGRVLDYGCGWGGLSIGLRDKGYTVMGIDLSQNEIDICRLAWPGEKGVQFERARIGEFDARTFDYVLSSQVIEHVHNCGIYLSQISRVLKDSGRLVITLPNIMNFRFFLAIFSPRLISNLKRQNREYLSNYVKSQHHINAWDPYHFVTLASSLGFELEQFHPMEGMAFPMWFPYFRYVNTRLPVLRNLSYTMGFVFRKTRDVVIGPDD